MHAVRSGKSTTQKLARIIIAIAIVLIALQAALALLLTPGIRLALSSSLQTDSRVDRVYLNLFGGSLSITGLEIGQPTGFGDDLFVSLGRAEADISLASLLIGRIRIEEIALRDLAVSIITASNGVMNITRLTTSTNEPHAGETGSAPEPETAERSNAGPRLKIDRLQVENLSFTMIDHSKSGPPLDIHLVNAELRADHLWFEPEHDRKKLLGTVYFRGQLEHADTPPSHVGLSARLGPIAGGLPPAVGGIVIAGLELNALAPWVPTGVPGTLGGNVIDVDLTFSIAKDVLAVNGYVESVGGKFPIKVSGIPDKPIIDAGAILFSAFSRLSNLLGNTAGNIANVGIAAGKGAVNAAAAVGSGAAGIIGSVGKGLLDTAKSAATLDVKGVGSGLAETVTGAGKEAVATVNEVGTGAIATLGETATAGGGSERNTEWQSGKESRFTPNWAAAQSWVASAAYPAPDTKHSSNPVD